MNVFDAILLKEKKEIRLKVLREVLALFDKELSLQMKLKLVGNSRINWLRQEIREKMLEELK